MDLLHILDFYKMHFRRGIVKITFYLVRRTLARCICTQDAVSSICGHGHVRTAGDAKRVAVLEADRFAELIAHTS